MNGPGTKEKKYDHPLGLREALANRSPAWASRGFAALALPCLLAYGALLSTEGFLDGQALLLAGATCLAAAYLAYASGAHKDRVEWPGGWPVLPSGQRWLTAETRKWWMASGAAVLLVLVGLQGSGLLLLARSAFWFAVLLALYLLALAVFRNWEWYEIQSAQVTLLKGPRFTLGLLSALFAWFANSPENRPAGGPVSLPETVMLGSVYGTQGRKPRFRWRTTEHVVVGGNGVERVVLYLGAPPPLGAIIAELDQELLPAGSSASPDDFRARIWQGYWQPHGEVYPGCYSLHAFAYSPATASWWPVGSTRLRVEAAERRLTGDGGRIETGDLEATPTS
jgi:hypothetical protein